MRTWIRVTAGAAALSAAALAIALGLVLERAPLVAARADATPADIEHAVRLARRHDPRRFAGPFVRSIDMSERDADLLLHHVVQRRWPVSTRLALGSGRATVQASLPLPAGFWLNLEVGLLQARALPTVDKLRLGDLPVPARWAEAALVHVASRYGIDAEAALSADIVQRVQMRPGRARVQYIWLPGSGQRLLASVMPVPEQQRLAAYYRHLATTSHAFGWMQPVALADLLPPLFSLAAARSASGDAAAENRAAILALALFANRRGVASLLLSHATGPMRPMPLRVMLNGREDSTLHFLVSAALAADAGTPLAEAVGLYKEIADARAGSGFSFNDLAADRAGTRFGELSKATPERLQAAMAAQPSERDFMPEVADLPESMTESEFVGRFGGVGAPAYRRLLAEIERRITERPLFQHSGGT